MNAENTSQATLPLTAISTDEEIPRIPSYSPKIQGPPFSRMQLDSTITGSNWMLGYYDLITGNDVKILDSS